MATRAGEGLWPEPLVLSATKTERAFGRGSFGECVIGAVSSLMDHLTQLRRC